MNTSARVVLVCLWLGVASFGGGLAIVPEMHRQFVEANTWLSGREFADGYALAQLSPGPNMLAVVFYAYRVAGIAAALLAPIAIAVPGAVMAAVLGNAWATLSKNIWVERLRRAVLPVGLGLMAGGVFLVGRTTITSWPLLVGAAAAGVLVNRKWLHPAIAVLLMGAIAVAARL